MAAPKGSGKRIQLPECVPDRRRCHSDHTRLQTIDDQVSSRHRSAGDRRPKQCSRWPRLADLFSHSLRQPHGYNQACVSGSNPASNFQQRYEGFLPVRLLAFHCEPLHSHAASQAHAKLNTNVAPAHGLSRTECRREEAARQLAEAVFGRLLLN